MPMKKVQTTRGNTVQVLWRGGVRPARLELVGLEDERIAILVSAVLRSDDRVGVDLRSVDGKGVPHVALCSEFDAGVFRDVVQRDGEGPSIVGAWLARGKSLLGVGLLLDLN